eukprot:TRINITY_DN9285_c0_g1_i1.p1 TRINITY_DN9285_c0_g1~~TRINITY_DN9285_c0_g1_i1.p1  ORF type:complete len:629 (+),score=132.64 TRINITY_DN9285_c0_g1_i1:59-1945(+)
MKYFVTFFIIILLQIGLCEKISLLHTTDIHAWVYGHTHETTYSGTFGDVLSFYEQLKTYHNNNNDDFLLIDTGDLTQGTGFSDVQEPYGSLMLKAVEYLPYDFMTIGNHELGIPSLMTHFKNWDFLNSNKYICSNSFFAEEGNDECSKNKNIGIPYIIKQLPNTNVKALVIGLVEDPGHLPETVCLIDIIAALDNEEMHQVYEKGDYDVILGLLHIGSKTNGTNDVETFLRSVPAHKTRDLPIIFLNGHTHIRNYVFYKDKNSVRLESEWALKHIGLMSVEMDKTDKGYTLASVNHTFISVNTEDLLKNLPDTKEWKPTTNGQLLDKYIDDQLKSLNLDKVLGKAPYKFRKNGRISQNDSMKHLYVKMIFPSVLKPRISGIPIFVLNSGSMRNNIYEGNVTLGDVYTVDPFNNPYETIRGLSFTEATALIHELSRINHEDWSKYTWSLFEQSSEEYPIIGTSYDIANFVDILNRFFPNNNFKRVKLGINSRDALIEMVKNNFIVTEPTYHLGIEWHMVILISIIIVLVAVGVYFALIWNDDDLRKKKEYHLLESSQRRRFSSDSQFFGVSPDIAFPPTPKKSQYNSGTPVDWVNSKGFEAPAFTMDDNQTNRKELTDVDIGDSSKNLI